MVTFRSCVITTVVRLEFTSVMPVPDHPAKRYSAFGVAVIGTEEFQSKTPAPVTVPPVPPDARRVYLLIANEAETLRSWVMSTVVVEALRSAMASPLHPMNE